MIAHLHPRRRHQSIVIGIGAVGLAAIICLTMWHLRQPKQVVYNRPINPIESTDDDHQAKADATTNNSSQLAKAKKRRVTVALPIAQISGGNPLLSLSAESAALLSDLSANTPQLHGVASVPDVRSSGAKGADAYASLLPSEMEPFLVSAAWKLQPDGWNFGSPQFLEEPPSPQLDHLKSLLRSWQEGVHQRRNLPLVAPGIALSNTLSEANISASGLYSLARWFGGVEGSKPMADTCSLAVDRAEESLVSAVPATLTIAQKQSLQVLEAGIPIIWHVAASKTEQRLQFAMKLEPQFTRRYHLLTLYANWLDSQKMPVSEALLSQLADARESAGKEGTLADRLELDWVGARALFATKKYSDCLSVLQGEDPDFSQLYFGNQFLQLLTKAAARAGQNDNAKQYLQAWKDDFLRPGDNEDVVTDLQNEIVNRTPETN